MVNTKLIGSKFHKTDAFRASLKKKAQSLIRTMRSEKTNLVVVDSGTNRGNLRSADKNIVPRKKATRLFYCSLQPDHVGLDDSKSRQ